MPGMLDKLKETFGKAKTKAGDVANSESMDSIKGKAGQVAGKAGEVAGKVGEKMPDKVKDTYGKVSEKVTDKLPGGGDAPADTAEATTVEEMTTADPAPATDEPTT
jgi:uncharacterized protein YjbJ (UPF0337 family)